jgi:hypothetical protein
VPPAGLVRPLLNVEVHRHLRHRGQALWGGPC